MTVTSPQGFRAAGVAAGLKTSGNPDVALVVNDGPQDAAAAVFTTNRFPAAPTPAPALPASPTPPPPPSTSRSSWASARSTSPSPPPG